MGIKLNGHDIPWSLVVAGVAFIGTAGGLQWQVNNNTKVVESVIPTVTQVAVLKNTQEQIKKDLGNIEAHTAAQTQLLNEVVRQLAILNERQSRDPE